MTKPTQRRTIDELEADNMKLRRLLAFRVGRSHDDALTRRMMVEIAALAVANIERIDRAAA